MTIKDDIALVLDKCPFCKIGKAKITHHTTRFDGQKVVSISCCATILDTEENAIRRWNTRASDIQAADEDDDDTPPHLDIEGKPYTPLTGEERSVLEMYRKHIIKQPPLDPEKEAKEAVNRIFLNLEKLGPTTPLPLTLTPPADRQAALDALNQIVEDVWFEEDDAGLQSVFNDRVDKIRAALTEPAPVEDSVWKRKYFEMQQEVKAHCDTYAAEFGIDMDYPEDLNAADILEKHLLRPVLHMLPEKAAPVPEAKAVDFESLKQEPVKHIGMCDPCITEEDIQNIRIEGYNQAIDDIAASYHVLPKGGA